MPTGVQLAGETKNSFVQHFEYLKESNVCKQIYLPYGTQAEAEFFK